MKTTQYSTNGKTAGEIEIPDSVFGVDWNSDLVHQVVTVQRANRRTPVAHTKDRSERRGGGAKPWRQKGTGRARHGSRRSPIWRKGGVTHGPRNEKVLHRDLPAKMRRKALFAVLSRKYRDGEILFVDQLGLNKPKTAAAKQALHGISAASDTPELVERRRNAAYIAVPSFTDAEKKSFRNFSNIHFDELRNMNALDVASFKYVVIANPEEALRVFDSERKDA